MKQGEMKDLNVIIKGDVQGSVEALATSLMKIDVKALMYVLFTLLLGLLMNQMLH